MYGSLDISTSALVAHRTRLNVISTNIANAQTILNERGEYEPFRRRIAMLAPGDPASGRTEGVHVSDIRLDQSPFLKKLEPGSPYADDQGYVSYPNINTTIESINALEAARSYEANIQAIEGTKSMISVALQMIA